MSAVSLSSLDWEFGQADDAGLGAALLYGCEKQSVDIDAVNCGSWVQKFRDSETPADESAEARP